MEVGRLRGMAMAKGFQGRLGDMAVPSIEELAHFSFHYQPGQYPARQMYQGSYEFSKHFYPVIHDLREKTQAGAVAEEFRCAQAIDSHAKVKQWVRNIERQDKFSFWLPTATNYFIPTLWPSLPMAECLRSNTRASLTRPTTTRAKSSR